MAAVAMADRVSLESLFRARDISNEPRPRRHALRSLLPRGSPATRAARGASASAVRWRAIQTPTTGVSDAAARAGIATARATSRGGSAETRHDRRWGGRETTSRCSTSSSSEARASRLRRRREDPRRSLVRVPAYVGDGTGPEPEIIVAGDGAAIVLEDEEAKSRKLGWDFALSRVGQELDVIIDGFNPDFDAWVGRSSLEAPDIDPIVFVSEPEPGSGLPALEMGQMRRCKVNGTSLFDLEAHPLS